jgi:uncharacterized protein YjbI with pentapeptide repeats
MPRNKKLNRIEPTKGSSDLKKLLRKDVEIAISKKGDSKGLDLSNKDLSNLDLSNMNLSRAILKGSLLHRTDFSYSDLSYSDLSDCVISDATFKEANLSNSKLIRSDFTNSFFRNTNFHGATLYRAKLDGAVFPQANLKMTSIFRASLNGAEITKDNFGNNILQDNKKEFEVHLKRFVYNKDNADTKEFKNHLEQRFHEAIESYRSLKKLFLDSGRYSDASWAYIRERQARRKSHFPTNAKFYYNKGIESIDKLKFIGRLLFSARHLFKWLADWAAELSCGYGERPSRTLMWAALIIPTFAFFFFYFSGIVSDFGQMTWIDYLNYSVAAFSTIGFNQYTAITPLSQTLTSIEAMLGISTFALLMYALGNKISRS